jgi:hypothetical protein
MMHPKVKKILKERFEPLSIALENTSCSLSPLDLSSFSTGADQAVVLFSRYNQDDILKSLRSGVRVFLLDSDLSKMATFLEKEGVRELLEHPFFSLFHLSHESQVMAVARKIIPDSCAFIGDGELSQKIQRAYIDLVLAFSDQKDFFGQKLINIQKNLLKTDCFYDFTALKDSFKGKEALLLGSGESLFENIEKIRELQKNFVIIACGSTALNLRKLGVEPDFIVYVDPHPLDKKALLQDISSCPLFMSLRSSCDFVAAHRGKKVLVSHNCSQIQNWYKNELGLKQDELEIGCSSGSMGGAICQELGFRRVYCIGFDAKERVDHKRAREFIQDLSNDLVTFEFDIPSTCASMKEIHPLKRHYCIEKKRVLELHQTLFNSMESFEDELLTILSLKKSKRTIAAFLEHCFRDSLFYQQHVKESSELFFDTRIGIDVVLEKGLFAVDMIKRARECKHQIF